MHVSDGFLNLAARSPKPRTTGLTHVIDKGLPTCGLLAQVLVAITRLIENKASRRLGRGPSKRVRTPQAVSTT